jgi:phage/plasmid-associated DNA primase
MWLAQMVQYPQHKSMCMIYKSGEGTGKNTLIEFIGAILGNGKLFETSKPDKDVWGDFNGKMKDAFLVHLTEIDYKKCADKSAIYNLITDATVTINEKGKNQYTVNSYHRFLGSTNSDYPIFDSTGGRRFLLIECSDEMKGNSDYFTTLRKYTHDPIVQRTFYDYLMNYETKAVITESDIPKTEFHQKIREASKDTMDSFIEDLVMDNYNKTEVKISSLQLWDSFKLFCIGSNVDCKMSKQQFSTRIGMRKITGFNNLGPVWYNGKMNRVFSLDIPALKEHFNIVEPTEFVEIV